MATKKKRSARRTPRRQTATAGALVLEGSEAGGGGTPEFGLRTTGAQIVTFMDTSRRSVRSALATMKSKAGVAQVCHMSDFGTRAFSFEETEDADAVMFDELGIAVMRGESQQMAAVAGVQSEALADVVVEPEYVNHVFTEGLDDDLRESGPPEAGDGLAPGAGGVGVSADYLRGYRDGVAQLTRSISGEAPDYGAARVDYGFGARAFEDTRSATWGLQATQAIRSRSSGNGTRIAVLDTGFDMQHPDFAGRSVSGQSFIAGESVQDGHGHGTHCIGTACGPERPGVGPRYGIAFDAQIFAGKVLSDSGSGGDASILAGINWAMQNKCQVVSMSLGRRVRSGEAPMRSYETAGQRALRAGTLIVAAAGNDSSRPFSIIPVSSPANAASIAAIAALDSRLRVAVFSNGGLNPGGGEINLAAPGVAVHSSWPMPIRLRSISGTSMATPHVAGLAALVAEDSATARGVELYFELRRRTRRLALPRSDVGSGLARAI